MAQAEEALDNSDSETDEAEELNKLLGAQDPEEGEAEEGIEKLQAMPEEEQGFLFSKKFWIFGVGCVVILAALIAGAYFFLQAPKPEVEDAVSLPPRAETVKPSFDKVHSYALKPFFLPLKANNEETGNFISVIPHFILSNPTLNEEIEKVIPAIRKNIYNILIRKSPRDYFLRKGKIEEIIKKEILISVNPLLLAGTGTVEDVVFTQFVVK